MRSNLPPGCTSDDGMTSEDYAWEFLMERIGNDASVLDLNASEATAVWELGCAMCEALSGKFKLQSALVKVGVGKEGESK